MPTILPGWTVRGTGRVVRKRTWTCHMAGNRGEEVVTVSIVPGEGWDMTGAMPQMRTVTARMSLWPVGENCQPTSRQGWPQLGAVGRQGPGQGEGQGWGRRRRARTARWRRWSR